MKKFFIFIISFFIFINDGHATSKYEVSLEKCVDGDTAWFIKDGDKIKTRFLAIDTPESTTTIEKYGKEASEYTCNLLTEASKIEIQYDPDSDQTDKYDRHLVWIFVDNELLQEKVVENGLAEVAYLYGDYIYTNDLEIAQKQAKKDMVGIWSEEDTIDEDSNSYFIIGIVILIIVCIFSKKTRNKVIRKTKNSLKKEIRKAYKDL